MAYSKLGLAAALMLVLVAAAPPAAGQAWPTRSARIIVPFPPGGGTDTQGRLLAKKLTESLGQTR